MRRTIINCAVLLCGTVLVCGGEYTLTNFDMVVRQLGWSASGAGRAVICAMNDILPCGVPLGFLAVGLGTLLVAIVIGLPAGPPAAVAATIPGLANRPRARRLVVVLIVAAASLAALGSVLSIRTQPGTWPPLLWLATCLVPVAAMVISDRSRGTRLGNPFPQRREWGVVLLLVVLDLLLVGHDMTHWRWAGTPDEADFFGVAKSIALGTSERAVLSEGGVFDFQPVLSSYYPALFMLLFGTNVFAWKLSSAVALAGSLPFTYVWARELWNRRTALLATVFFGSAQLAVGFSHFGYNNVQVYLIIAGGLGMLAWARPRQSLLGYYLAGCIAGMGFYTYYTARVVAPLLILLVWSYDGFPLARRVRARTLALLFGLGLTILPIFSDLGTLVHNMQQLALTGEQASTPSATASRVVEHWFLSIVHGLWYPGPHHFQSNPIQDPISGTLAVVGFWLCLGGWRRHTNGRFLALAYVLSAGLVGATSPHIRPPLTRLLFLSPFTALLAALGADQLLRVIEGDTPRRRRVAYVTAATLVATSVIWNIATLEHSVRDEHHGYGPGTMAELIRMAQQLPAPYRMIFVQRTDVQSLADNVMEEYGMEDRFTYRYGVDAATLEVLRTAVPPLVVFVDLSAPEEIVPVDTVLGQRFPNGVWRGSDPGQPWNVRYFEVSGAGASS